MLLSASVPAKSMWPPPSPHARSVRLTLVHPPKLLWIPHRSEAKEIWGDTQQTGPESQAYRAGRTLQSDRKDLVCSILIDVASRLKEPDLVHCSSWADF